LDHLLSKETFYYLGSGKYPTGTTVPFGPSSHHLDKHNNPRLRKKSGVVALMDI